MKTIRRWLTSLCLSTFAACSAAVAQQPDQGAPDIQPPPPSSATTEQPPAVQPASAAGAEASSAPAAQPAAPAQGGVAPGPLAEQRQKLLERIEQSRKLGIGVGPYRTAFGQVEEMVKSGATQEMVQKRIDSLNGSLIDQVKRIRDIKSRPPMAPGAATAPAPAQTASAAAGSHGSDPMIEQLKARFGAQIPAGIDRQQLIEHLKDKYGDQIPGALANPAVRDRLMQSEVGQRILEKLQQH